MYGQATFATTGDEETQFLLTEWLPFSSILFRSGAKVSLNPTTVQRGQCSQCIFAAKNRTRVLQGDGKCIVLRKGCCTSERFWNLSNSQQTPFHTLRSTKPIETHPPYNCWTWLKISRLRRNAILLILISSTLAGTFKLNSLATRCRFSWFF